MNEDQNVDSPNEAWLTPCDNDGNLLEDEKGILIRINKKDSTSPGVSGDSLFSINQIPVDKVIQTGSELAEYMYLNKHMIFEAVGKPQYLENLQTGRWKLVRRKSDGSALGGLIEADGKNTKFKGQLGFLEEQNLKPKALVGSIFSVMSMVTAQYYLADISKQLTELNELVAESIDRQQNKTLASIIADHKQLMSLSSLLTYGFNDINDIGHKLALIEKDLDTNIIECMLNIQANKAFNKFENYQQIFSEKANIADAYNALQKLPIKTPLLLASFPFLGWEISGGVLAFGLGYYGIKEKELSTKRNNVYKLDNWLRGVKDILMLVTAINTYHLWYQLRLQWLILSDNYSQELHKSLTEDLQEHNTKAIEIRKKIDDLGALLSKIQTFEEPFFNIGNIDRRKDFLKSLKGKHRILSDICQSNESQYLKMRIEVNQDGKLLSSGTILNELPSDSNITSDQ